MNRKLDRFLACLGLARLHRLHAAEAFARVVADGAQDYAMVIGNSDVLISDVVLQKPILAVPGTQRIRIHNAVLGAGAAQLLPTSSNDNLGQKGSNQP